MASTADNTATTTTTTWTCAACMDQFAPDAESGHRIGEDDYCFPCLKKRMDMVLDSSDGHPCEIGGAMLDPGMFPAALFGGEQA